MPCSIPQNLDEVLTPSRKRKRDRDDIFPHSRQSGLTNDGFSSTPQKGLVHPSKFLGNGSKRVQMEGINQFVSTNACMEVKSIAELLASEKSENENPYEVIRKPPKKKKKAHIEDACFENPALNLDGPEKRFNPFEVKRDSIVATSNVCFVNSALNIKSPENAAVNPYEITRTINDTIEVMKEGIENPALEEPTPVTITLPFAPNIGCRIDFNGVSLDNLTPSKLLAEKLVFSPPAAFKGSACKKPFRRSLSVISEETVDIGKELDCYQLELENSINEAKLKKKPGTTTKNTLVKWNDGSFNEDLEANINTEEQEDHNKSSISINITNINISIGEKSPASVPTPPVVNVPATIEETNDADMSFDDDIDFKEPAPFVRCYRKSELPRSRSSDIDQVQNVSKNSNKSNDSEKYHKNKISNLIRKSIRKIMNPHYQNKKEGKENSVEEEPDVEKHDFMATLRRSMRRKNNKNNPNDDKNNLKDNKNDIQSMSTEELSRRDVSIIDPAEKRQVFKFVEENESENGKNTINTENHFSFRKSFRRSTRDIRNKVLKKVFNKNFEEYEMKDEYCSKD